MNANTQTLSRRAQRRKAIVSRLAHIPEFDEVLSVSIERFGDLTGISRSATYRAIERGDLKAYRSPIGRAVILVEDAKAFLGSLPVFAGRRKAAASQ